jgi:hypothetical protein
MSYRHAAVWIDHHEARVFHIDDESPDAVTVRAPQHHLRRHPVITAEKSHPQDANHFYHDVANALEGAEAIVVVGPATAKLEFIKHASRHDPAVAANIVGVETVDHPTDGQLLKYIRAYFQTPHPRP